MNLPEFGVNRPVTNLMIFCGVLILAAYSLTRIGIDNLPTIEPPVVSVISVYPGASPEDVETRVTEPLEDQLSTTPGLEKMTSKSSEGVSLISLKFIWGTNLDEASNDIRDRIDLSKRFLPDIPSEMENPFIFKFNTANIPIIFIGVTAEESYPKLRDMIDKRIGDALRQLPGVGTVQFQGGGLERQINVWIDRMRLEAYGFSVLDIQEMLKQENLTQPIGNIKSGFTDYFLRLPGEFATPEEIGSVILGKRDGSLVYLRDVASIEDGFKEAATIARINTRPGIIMMVQKQSGSNTVTVARRVKKKLSELVLLLPSDVRAHLVFDTSEDIIRSLRSLSSSVWFAVVLVILVVWFFLRRLTPSMIIALTIPFSLLISFIYIFLSGKTINTVTLSSLAIASGMVVDSAIVVVDNICRRLERGQRPKEASIFGASEMFLAIGASTFTTVVVFVPLLFIPGVIGIMFGELAVIVIVTLMSSLFTAVTFTPMLCSRWLKKGADDGLRRRTPERFYAVSENWFQALEAGYGAALAWCLNHKKTVVGGSAGLFLLSLLLFRFVGTEFIPEQDTGDLRITVHLPLGTRIEETDKVARRIERIFQSEVPEARYLFVRSGQIPGIGRIMGSASGSHIISAGAKLIPRNQRRRSTRETAHVIRSKISEIPGVLKTDLTTGNPIGRLVTGGGGKSIQLEILGHSFRDMDAMATDIKRAMEGIQGVVDVAISRENDRPEAKIVVDREKAAGCGLRTSAIAHTLGTFFAGSVATKFREEGETYDISLRLEEASRSRLAEIESISLPVATEAGRPAKFVSLANIARLEMVPVPDEIERKNRERVVKVECNTYRRSSGAVIDDIKRAIAKMTIPRGVSIGFGGEAEEQKKAFTDLFLLLLLGIILVYMVMAAQFESLLDPFIIMFAVPFASIGVVVGFLATGVTLSAVSFLGIVMLVGIVVNNAIVLISYIGILRARGLSCSDAVTSGGRERLRPVLMTTVTTLVGLLPLALSAGEGSEVWRPLGVVMIGGMTTSAFITLLFVPTLYAIFEEKIKNGNPPGKPLVR